MQTHTHNNRRIVQHDDQHYDIEELRPYQGDTGKIKGLEWAVIYCSLEDEMKTDRELARKFLNTFNARIVEAGDNWIKYILTIHDNGANQYEYWLETFEPYSLKKVQS